MITALDGLQGLLFDFDGTLAPNLDLPDLRNRVCALTATFGVPGSVFADAYIVEIIDLAHAWLITEHAPSATAYRQQAHQLIVDFEVQAAQQTEPFPGIRALLGELRTARFKLGVVTRNCAAAVLEVFPDLLEHVDCLHARDHTVHLKPDPRHLQVSLNTLGIRAENAAMIGDGKLDMQAGRRLDMYCIGVLTGSSTAADLRQAGAHQVLRDCLALAL